MNQIFLWLAKTINSVSTVFMKNMKMSCVLTTTEIGNVIFYHSVAKKYNNGSGILKTYCTAQNKALLYWNAEGVGVSDLPQSFSTVEPYAGSHRDF